MSKINTKITKTNNSRAIFRKGVLLSIAFVFCHWYGIANAKNKNIRVTNADERGYKGTATLSTMADGTKQMSDPWIRGNNRLIDAVGGNQAIYDDILNSGYKRLLAEIAPDGTVIYKELDASSNVLRMFNP